MLFFNIRKYAKWRKTPTAFIILTGQIVCYRFKEVDFSFSLEQHKISQPRTSGISFKSFPSAFSTYLEKTKQDKTKHKNVLQGEELTLVHILLIQDPCGPPLSQGPLNTPPTLRVWTH